MPKRIIRRKIFMGDSLSDRGTLDHLKLGGFIPMSVVSGLASKSPRGRFTNGFLWIDMLGAAGVEQLEIDHWRYHLGLKDTASDNAYLADLIVAKKLKRNRDAFTLDDDKNILFNGERYIRTYCEGGATAGDWEESISLNPANEGARLVVSNLEKKREQLFNDDERYNVSDQEKAETLVTEWSGANDLITVNSKPNHDIADKAVAARIANIEAMIKNGYRNFVVMNLPDLGMTPRYVKKGGEEQQNATECSQYFNQELAKEVAKLKLKYNDVFLDVFEVDKLLTEVYQDPEKYKFKKELLTTPYTESEDFKKNQQDPLNKYKGTSPSEGYMFWDDVHPTADMHAWLAEKYMEKYDKEFSYKSPTVHPPGPSAEERRVKDEYGLIVSEQMEERKYIPTYASSEIQSKIDEILKKMECHCQRLEKDKTKGSVANLKGIALRNLLNEIKYADKDLIEINKILNSDASNGIFAVPQNPRWDAFWKKSTTRSQDELYELRTLVSEGLNEQDPNLSATPESEALDEKDPKSSSPP